MFCVFWTIEKGLFLSDASRTVIAETKNKSFDVSEKCTFALSGNSIVQSNRVMITKRFISTLAAASFLVIGASATARAAELFSIDNIALNTNWYFRRFDGNPRMSIYTKNLNDPDQQFDRLSGNRGGILLKQRSTGRCLNAHYLWNGAEINVWPCNANDPDQNWNLIPVSGGRMLIRRAGTNLCVDTPTRNNEGKVHLWGCNSNNPNQRWQITGTQSPGNSRIHAALNNLYGRYSIRDPYGRYPGQCVSFVKRFTRELGFTMRPMGGNGGAKYGFINFNRPGLSLSASQAYKINFTGSQRPQVGDIIFFDSTSRNPYGHVAVVQSVLGNGRIIIQESNADSRAPNTSVTRGEINLRNNPPKAYYGRVLGWLRLKL
ncbi:MAG: CHAP domain-containing protein [Cyanobacteriota bacterium]|nr:CHAP domain-containing protein [Cyanobacteriota bacterium]